MRPFIVDTLTATAVLLVLHGIFSFWRIRHSSNAWVEDHGKLLREHKLVLRQIARYHLEFVFSFSIFVPMCILWVFGLFKFSPEDLLGFDVLFQVSFFTLSSCTFCLLLYSMMWGWQCLFRSEEKIFVDAQEFKDQRHFCLWAKNKIRNHRLRALRLKERKKWGRKRVKLNGQSPRAA